MNVFRNILRAIIFLLACAGLTAESLWTPDFQGYLSGNVTIQEGDIVYVEIDAASTLSFSSSSSDSRSITLEFSGGEYGDLFSFLPLVTTGEDQALKGKEEYTYTSLIGTRIIEIDSTGKARIQGSRGISFGGKEESITLSGWADSRYLGPQNKIKFSQLADATLQFRTFLQPSTVMLADEDIEEIIRTIAVPEGASSPPGGALVPTGETSSPPGGALVPTGEAPPPTGGTAGTETVTTYRLSETRKKELLLLYLNRLVDLIFR